MTQEEKTEFDNLITILKQMSVEITALPKPDEVRRAWASCRTPYAEHVAKGELKAKLAAYNEIAERIGELRPRPSYNDGDNRHSFGILHVI